MTTDQQAAPDPSGTEKPNWLTLDRQLALRTGASRLGDQFADRVSVTRFLPLLACPAFPGKRYEVERRVLTLMSELDLTPAETGSRA